MKSSAIEAVEDVSKKDEFEVTIKIDRNRYYTKPEYSGEAKLKDFNYLAEVITDQLEKELGKELDFSDSDVNRLGIYIKHIIENRFHLSGHK